mgnify:CR=1 FL=1
MAGDEALSLEDFGAISVAAAMLALFMLSRLIEMFVHWYKSYNRRGKIKTFLIYEIRINLTQINRAVQAIPDTDQLRNIFEMKGDAVILAPFADDTFFFSDIKNDLDIFGEDVFWEVMKFYSLLRAIEVYSSTVGSDAFARLTIGGKISAAQAFAQKHHEAKEQGERAISLLESRR